MASDDLTRLAHQSRESGQRGIDRRQFLKWAGAAGLGLTAAACAPSPAPAPATAPPGAAPTTAPAAAPTAAPKVLTPVKVKVGTIEGVIELMNYEVGKRKGFFKEEGVDLEITGVRAGNILVQGLQAGEFDICDGGTGAFLAAIASGANFRHVGNSRPKLNFVVYSRKGINTIDDLKGKNYGTADPGSFLHLVTLSWFNLKKFDEKQVQFVNAGASPQVFQAIVTGKVDAGPSGVEFLPAAQREGLNVLAELWKELPNYVRVALYARTPDITNPAKRDALVRFMTAYAKTFRYMYDPKSKDDFVQASVEVQKRKPEDAEFAWKWQRDNRVIAANLEFTQADIDFMQEENIKTGGQKEKLPLDKLATYELQKEVIAKIGEFKYPS